MHRLLKVSALCAGLLCLHATAHATPVLDPAGDFLSTLHPDAPRAGDLDVLSSEVFFLGDRFLFTATLNAPINTTEDAFYVWGVDRGNGAATQTFAHLGLPGIVFDAVVVIQNEGTGVVNLFPGGATPLAAGSVTVSDNTIEAIVPLAMLASNGFAPSAYGWNLWPRWGGIPFSDPQISDFAPDDTNAQVTTVPEPSTLVLLALGLAGTGVGRRLRTRRA